MLEAFVIAFIHCAGQHCAISVWSDRAKKIHTAPMTPEMKALHRCASAKDEAAR